MQPQSIPLPSTSSLPTGPTSEAWLQSSLRILQWSVDKGIDLRLPPIKPLTSDFADFLAIAKTGSLDDEGMSNRLRQLRTSQTELGAFLSNIGSKSPLLQYVLADTNAWLPGGRYTSDMMAALCLKIRMDEGPPRSGSHVATALALPRLSGNHVNGSKEWVINVSSLLHSPYSRTTKDKTYLGQLPGSTASLIAGYYEATGPRRWVAYVIARHSRIIRTYDNHLPAGPFPTSVSTERGF